MAGKRFLESPLNRARWSRDRALKAIAHYEKKIELLRDEARYYEGILQDLRSRQKPSDMTEETRRQFEESRRAVEADIAARSSIKRHPDWPNVLKHNVDDLARDIEKRASEAASLRAAKPEGDA